MIVCQQLGHSGQTPFWRIGRAYPRLAPVDVLPGALPYRHRQAFPGSLKQGGIAVRVGIGSGGQGRIWAPEPCQAQE